MTSNQKQSAAEGATAIQSTGSVVINNGLFIDQMSELLTAISNCVDRFSEKANVEIDKRLADFKSSILERFANDKNTRPEAFGDPDFQGAVFDAQKAFARSGDSRLQDVLTDLVANRSMQNDRSRLTLTLNDAIALAGSIPKSDLNLMSLIFLLQNMQRRHLASIPDLAHFFNLVVEPCMKEVSGGDFSLKYLSSHACLTLTPTMMQSGGSFDIIMERYPGEITKGATELVLREAFQDFDLLKMRGLIVDSVYGDSLLTFAVGSEGAINSVFSHLGFFGDHAERYLKIARENLPERDSFIRKAERDCPSIRNFMDLYDQPQVRNATLTSIGIALAHANLPKEISARAPLSVWVSD